MARMKKLAPLLLVGGAVALIAVTMRKKPGYATSFTTRGIEVRNCRDFIVRDSTLSIPAFVQQYRNAAEELQWTPENAEALLTYAMTHMFPSCKFPNRGARFHEEGVQVTWGRMVELLAANIEMGFDPRKEAAAPSVNWNRSVFLGVM